MSKPLEVAHWPLNVYTTIRFVFLYIYIYRFFLFTYMYAPYSHVQFAHIGTFFFQTAPDVAESLRCGKLWQKLGNKRDNG